MPRTVKPILIDALKQLGADGLCNNDVECGCGLDDLVPCCEDCTGCEPARQVTAEQARELGYWLHPDDDHIYVPM